MRSRWRQIAASGCTGQHGRLMRELHAEDESGFISSMYPTTSCELLRRLEPRSEKHCTNYGKPLDPGLRFAITLQYLAPGDSYTGLMYRLRAAIIPSFSCCVMYVKKSSLSWQKLQTDRRLNKCSSSAFLSAAKNKTGPHFWKLVLQTRPTSADNFCICSVCGTGCPLQPILRHCDGFN